MAPTAAAKPCWGYTRTRSHYMRFSRSISSILALLVLTGLGVSGQTQAPAPGAMSQQQINEEMLKELRQIRQLLKRLTQPQQPPPPPATARVTSLRGYVMGRADAPLTMVE